jgi:hypothetical protein
MSEPNVPEQQRRRWAPDEWPEASAEEQTPSPAESPQPWWETPASPESPRPAGWFDFPPGQPSPDPAAAAPRINDPTVPAADHTPAPRRDDPAGTPPAAAHAPAAAGEQAGGQVATLAADAPLEAAATEKAAKPTSEPAQPPPAGPTSGFIDGAAIVLILAALLMRAWAAWGGYFSLDDFTFARLAAEKGLTGDLLFTPYNSHFMPGAYLMVWLETTIAPLNYRVVAGVDLVLLAFSFLLSWMLIRRLAGPRLVALVPLAVVLISPITLPATLWWAVSINQLAMLIAIPGALLAQVTYIRTGKGIYAAIAVLTAAVALPFYEKIVLVVPLIFVLSVILQPQADLIDRVKSALKRHKAQWIAFVLFAMVYGGIYLTRPLERTKGDQAVDLGGLLGNAATSSVPSGLVGGPWQWKAIGAVDASAHPPVVGRIIAVVIILAVIALTVYRRPLAWQAWALLLGALAFDVLVLAVGRLQLGSGAAMEYRYFTDLVPVAAVALTLALVGVPEWAGNWPQRSGIEWPPVVGGTRLQFANANALVLPLVVALFISSMISTVKYADRWHANPAKPFVANAVRTINAMGRPVDIYNGAVPEKVAWGVLNPTNMPSRLLAPLKLPLNPDPDVSTDLYVLNSAGLLTHAHVTSTNAPVGKVKNCGTRVQGKRTGLFLDHSLFNWWWYAELHYSAATTTEVSFNSANTLGKKVTLEKGTHTVWIKVNGPATWISFDNVPKEAGVCLRAATVGVAAPGEVATP